MSSMDSTDRGRASGPVGFDAGFLRRVHRTGLVLSVFAALATAVYFGPIWGLGFLSCSLWSVVNLWVLERLVRQTMRPGGAQLSVVAVGVLVKMPILYGALIALLVFGGFPAASILLGLALPLFVIVMKIAGQLVTSRLGASASGVHPADPS